MKLQPLQNNRNWISPVVVITVGLLLSACAGDHGVTTIHKGEHIVLIGNNLGSRMQEYGFFDTELHTRYPDSLLYIRNMCDGGDTPGFRPHSSRPAPWAFPGAEKFQDELSHPSQSEGHLESFDSLIKRQQPDLIIGFFGFNESFQGEAGLKNYKEELKAFIDHTRSQSYNTHNSTELILVSPIAFQNLSKEIDLPDGAEENKNLALYSNAMREVAQSSNIPFIDVFSETKSWFKNERLTIDGVQLNQAGNEKFAKLLVDKIFGNVKPVVEKYRDAIKAAVLEKDWMWQNDFKIPNGVHIYGRRYDPFGQENYPAEIKKIRELTAIRDQAIWNAAKGIKTDLSEADKNTTPLPPVKTNYDPKENGSLTYLDGTEALKKFHLPPGYQIDLFASEKEFQDLAKPVQITFDNKGRLWVSTMPSYPHYKPGDSKPNDKIIILEDTDGNGKADKQITFAEGLHLPLGFEIAAEGVYVSQGTNLILLSDTNGDDKADTKEVLLSGFDDHDTHHAHHAYTADPSGAIYMGEGVFLHTNVETAYGPVRATNGGFYRYNPKRHHLERTAQLSIPNPWGIAFDEWGQNFFAETSGPDVRWMMPGSIKSRYGVATHKSFNLIEEEHKVRPTSGLEFLSSRHFPDEVQGDMLINNTIGFLGTKQHQMLDDRTGYATKFRQDLLVSDDRNFRPVDLEIAPDGSLYIADWHNILIGHMQHNARDPLRDHSHGRIYRITYPSRPLVEPAKIDDAPLSTLLDNLKLPEYRTRYRTRRELRGRPADQVMPELAKWVQTLDPKDKNYEHNLLEALWVSWGLNEVDQKLLNQLLDAKDYRARAAAVRVLRYNGHQISNQAELLAKAASDENNRVRLEAIVAASWLKPDAGLKVLAQAEKLPLDDWMIFAFETSKAHLNGKELKQVDELEIKTHLTGKDREAFILGKSIYNKEGYCITCHQPDGNGWKSSGFPPLKGTKWVTGNEARLIKIALNGLYGPIEVNGQEYPGQVPMTPFGRMLKDEEIAAVLTYVRNSFGNKASVITAEQVNKVRSETKSNQGFYSPKELLKIHPLEK